MEFYELAKARYSVKGFSSEKLPDDKLEKILMAGNVAPTAKNNQPHRIYVLRSEDALKKANELTRCIYGATTVLLITYNRDEVFTFPGNTGKESGDEDCSIVATHMMLEAADLSVGSCWVNLFDPESAKAMFNLPDNEEPVLLMPLGFPKEGVGPLPNHEKKKNLDEIVKYL